jgi:hypothetical protein
LREGKGEGGRETSGPVRRRWPEARGAAGPAAALGCRELEVEDEAGGPDRAGLGRAGRVATRPKGLFGLKMREKGKWAAGPFSNFSNKDLLLKTKDSNTFKPNLN